MSPLWQWFAAVIANRRDPGGGGEGRGPVHNPPPPPPAAAVAATSALGLMVLCRVVAAAAAAVAVAAATLRSLSDPRPRVQWGRTFGRRFPRGGWTMAGVIIRAGRSRVGRLGVSSLEALVGCLAQSNPGVRRLAWL